MKRSSITTLGILVAIVLVTVSSLPAAAQERYEAVSTKAMSSTEDLAEAETARALALDSQEFRQLTANEGLYRRIERPPLVFLKEENGRQFYAIGNQSVVFLGEREGQRVYQVALKLEGLSRSSRLSLFGSSAPQSRSVRQDSFVYVFVDLTARQVLEALWVDIGGQDAAGMRDVMLRNHRGQQAGFSAMSDGTLIQTNDNGVPMRRQIRPEDLEPGKHTCAVAEISGVAPDGVCQTICEPACTVLYFLVGEIVLLLSCAMVCAPTAQICWPVCALVATVVWVWVSTSVCNNVCRVVCG